MKIAVGSNTYIIHDISTNGSYNYRSILELIEHTNLVMSGQAEIFITHYEPPYVQLLLTADEPVVLHIPWISTDSIVVSNLRYEDVTLDIPICAKQGLNGRNGRTGRNGQTGKRGLKGKTGHRGFSGFKR